MVVTAAMTNQVMNHLAVATAAMLVTAAMVVTAAMANQVMSHLVIATAAMVVTAAMG